MKAQRPANSSASSPLRPLTREQIAALAHEIWIERGRPEGSDLDIWLEAERRLRGAPPPRRAAADDIPADPAHSDPAEDPAINPAIDREIDRLARPPQQRSPTSL